jgi:tetratricopeptide (TPR) repeat protein
MGGPSDRARKLAESWARRPSRAAALAIRNFYARSARTLPLPARSELCLALGEAAELEGRFESARYLYSSAVSAIDPRKDERAYARAAVRALLNASRLGDRGVLTGVAEIVERLPGKELTPRLAAIGAVARGLERLLKEDWTGARRAFEAAMSAAWESHDADAEALAHHLLAQAWTRLGRVARAKEHVEAALSAAGRAGSGLLERRLLLESIMFGLLARVTPEGLARARRAVEETRALGFPRLEAMAWSKLARGIIADRAYAETFLARSEDLLPAGHPDRVFVDALRTALLRQSADGAKSDAGLRRELEALARLARR